MPVKSVCSKVMASIIVYGFCLPVVSRLGLPDVHISDSNEARCRIKLPDISKQFFVEGDWALSCAASFYIDLPSFSEMMALSSDGTYHPLEHGEGYFDIIAMSQSNTNSSSSFEPEDPLKGNTRPKEIVTFHAATSVSDFPTTSQQSQNSDESQLIQIDAKTSTPAIQPCFYPGVNFYHRLQLLEWPEAHHHFDNGKILAYDLRNFRIMVGQFVCAFLNTNGGALYFGVTKAGKIVGVMLDHKHEDSVRIDIDSQVKEIKPMVPTSGYYVNFPKVMDDDGKIVNDLKVLEVKVRPPVRDNWYYTYKSVTYIWSYNTVEVYRP